MEVLHCKLTQRAFSVFAWAIPVVKTSTRLTVPQRARRSVLWDMQFAIKWAVDALRFSLLVLIIMDVTFSNGQRSSMNWRLSAKICPSRFQKPYDWDLSQPVDLKTACGEGGSKKSTVAHLRIPQRRLARSEMKECFSGSWLWTTGFWSPRSQKDCEGYLCASWSHGLT